MDLELVATDELIDELFKRYDHAVFAGIKEHDEHTNGVIKYYHGCHHIAIGLCQEVSAMVLEELLEQERSA